MVTKKQFLILFVAFFATFFYAFGQNTQNGKKFIIIDDYVVGKSSCRPTMNSLTLPPNRDYYLLTIQNSNLGIGVMFYAYKEDFWKFKYNISATGVVYKQPIYEFTYNDYELFKPEIDDNGFLTLISKNGTEMSASLIPNFSNLTETTDPCAFVTIGTNPTIGDTDLYIDSDLPQLAKITVYDNFGNIKQTKTNLSLTTGRTIERIQLGSEPVGLYKVIVETTDRRQVVTIQKI